MTGNVKDLYIITKSGDIQQFGLNKMIFVYGGVKMAKSYDYTIQRKSDGKYLTGIEPNEHYKVGGYVIQSNLHTFNEYNPVWGETPTPIFERSLHTYVNVVTEAFRWEVEKPTELIIKPVIEE